MISIHADEYRVFCIAWGISDYIFSLAANGPGLEDLREENKLATNCQTHCGLFIESGYGIFKSLWTPWGIWRFAGKSSGNWESSNKDIMRTLGLSDSRNDRPSIGKLYSVRHFKDEWLCNARTRTTEECFTNEECNAKWLYLLGLRVKELKKVRR